MSIKKFFIIPGVLSLFTLSSCIVGLGQAVDLEAPVVSITAPDYMANIGKSFIAEGTVSDNVAVTKLVVSFAGHSWTWEKESWSEGTDSSAILLFVAVDFFQVRVPLEAVTPMLKLNFSGITLYTKPILNCGVTSVVNTSVSWAAPLLVTV